MHEVDRLLARPAHRVEAGVDDEARGAEGLRLEHAEPLAIVGVEAHLVGEALGVEAPALDVRPAGHPRAERAERGQPLQLHLDRDLEVMAGRRLVERDRRELVELALGRLVGVDVVLAWRASRRATGGM